MATIKSYTSPEQSKALAKILPIESADMWWAEIYAGKVLENGLYIVEENPVYYPSFSKPSYDNYSQDRIKDIPCWSLAALLSVVHCPSLHKIYSGWRCDSYDEERNLFKYGEEANNQIDAVYEMVLKLHELKML